MPQSVRRQAPLDGQPAGQRNVFRPAADREAPAGQREWAIFARASWAFSFDNVTEIPEWLSNSLCKGVTGDAVL